MNSDAKSAAFIANYDGSTVSSTYNLTVLMARQTSYWNERVDMGIADTYYFGTLLKLEVYLILILKYKTTHWDGRFRFLAQLVAVNGSARYANGQQYCLIYQTLIFATTGDAIVQRSGVGHFNLNGGHKFFGGFDSQYSILKWSNGSEANNYHWSNGSEVVIGYRLPVSVKFSLRWKFKFNAILSYPLKYRVLRTDFVIHYNNREYRWGFAVYPRGRNDEEAGKLSMMQFKLECRNCIDYGGSMNDVVGSGRIFIYGRSGRIADFCCVGFKFKWHSTYFSFYWRKSYSLTLPELPADESSLAKHGWLLKEGGMNVIRVGGEIVMQESAFT